VAKRVQSGDHSSWLTALGVDFVQSFEVSPPVALDSLLGQPSSKENAGQGPASVSSKSGSASL